MTLPLFDDLELPGLLVTIDGPNGSGKTSVAAAVVQRLAESGSDRAVHSTCQPSPSQLGVTVRRMETDVRGRGLACLVAADRHNQLDSEIRPVLAAEGIVVCDRYIESSLVLQRIDGVDVDFILAVNSGIHQPGMRVRLYARESVLQQRIAPCAHDPSRRFEGMPDGPARELALYSDAEDILAPLATPALLLDTSESCPEEQAIPIVQAIADLLDKDQ